VATILGLLLVVTFVATYLSTTLPNQMSLNDLNHDLQVENQLGQLEAQLVAATQAGATGAQLSQPIALGSAGTPPFAGQDSGWTSALPQGSGIAVNYTVVGPAVYDPPLGYAQGGSPGTCAATATTLTCSTGSYSAHVNFAGNSQSFTLSFAASGFAATNVSTNSSTILASDSSSGGNLLRVIGSHDTVTVTGAGSGSQNITVIGTNDTISISALGSSPIVLYVYGDYDTITWPTDIGSGAVKIVVFGTGDQLAFPSVTSSAKFKVYLNGFSATHPISSLCPYGNVSATDSVTSFTATSSGTLLETLNNSAGYYANQTLSSAWTATFQNVHQTTCPFFQQGKVALTSGGRPGASFAVHLRNTYAPIAEVAFDQGAVVFAQPGGTPTLYEAPQIHIKLANATHGSTNYENVTQAVVWIPEFVGEIPGEAGTGTTDFSFNLLGIQNIVISPNSGLSANPSTPVNFTVTTPYAAAWLQYINTHAWPFTATCAPVNPATAAVCNGPYQSNVGLGKVTFAIPSTNLITLTISTAVFAVSVI
jgi:hypothetical protein